MLLQIGPFGILAFKDLTTVLVDASRGPRPAHQPATRGRGRQDGEVVRERAPCRVGGQARPDRRRHADHRRAARVPRRDGRAVRALPDAGDDSAQDRAAFAQATRATRPSCASRSATLVGRFLAQYRDVGRLELPETFIEPLITLADIVTRARSGVARDYQTRDILYLPEPEAPTRLAKQIAQLMAALLEIGVDENETWRLAREGRVGLGAGGSLRCDPSALASRGTAS